MIIPRSVNNEIFIGDYFKNEDSSASASHGCRIFDRWRVGLVHRPNKRENSLAVFPVKISIKLFHWRVIINITV